MGTQKKSDSLDFNVLQFEKTLLTLRDTQDSINSCCQWCLENRQYHKKIVTAWLNVLKRVKVEQRLVLFYLANDVVQYSKRRNYEYVGSWGTALQKATTLVREDRVKHKILRIFKIWEQRAVYTEDFIADLCGLINVSPGGIKNDDPHEFQATYVINKIKTCSNLEKDTDSKLKLLKEHNPKIQISENLITSLKDRAHVDDVEKETDVYVKHMENYINALKAEIKSRIALISVLRQAETQLESDRKDVKLVAHAYKTFGQRVKSLQKKLEEHMENLPSPVPSPDINAPSPSPDADLELPEDSPQKAPQNTTENNNQYNNSTPAYYNPATNTITTETETSNFLSNGFSSFIGGSAPFDISSNSALFSSQPAAVTTQEETYPNKAVDGYSSATYNPASTEIAAANYSYSTQVSEEYTAADNGSQFSYQEGADSYPPSQNNELYDPLEQSKTWESNETWNDQQETDTPESPPMYEKEGYGDPVEYHDGLIQAHGAGDVDQRVLPGMGDMDEPIAKKAKGKDVDHRNLISLTGSPGNSNELNEDVWLAKDQDYRNLSNPEPPSPDQPLDKDYRLQFNLDLPPPPPPPPKSPNHSSPKNGATLWPAAQPPLPMGDIDTRLPPPPPTGPPPMNMQGGPPPMNMQGGPPPMSMQGGPPPMSLQGVPPPMSMPPPPLGQSQRLSSSADDMDLSDEERQHSFEDQGQAKTKECHLGSNEFSLLPPPPLPDLLDDVDANQFLDEISNDINEFSNLDKDDNVMEMEEDEPEDRRYTGPPPAFQRENGRPNKRVPPGPPPGLPPGMQHMATMQPPPPPPKSGLLGDAPSHMAPLTQGLPPPDPPMPPLNFLPPGPMPNEMTMDLLPPPMPSGNWMGDNSEETAAPWSRDPRFRNMAPPPVIAAPLPPIQNEPEFYMDDFDNVSGNFNDQMPPVMAPPLLNDYPRDYPGDYQGDFQNFPMENFDRQQDFRPHDHRMDFQPRGGGRGGRNRNWGGDGGFHKGNRGGRGGGNRGRGDGNRRDHRGGGFRGGGFRGRGGGGFRGGNFRGGF